jgi:hypothetical protein
MEKKEAEKKVEIKVGSVDSASIAHSPLLDKLPGELRNHIYRLSLVSEAPLAFEFKGRKSSKRIVPAILQTSQQTRNEASRIYYNENKFALTAVVVLPCELQDGLNGFLERQSLHLNFHVTEMGAICTFNEVQERIYEIVLQAKAIKPRQGQEKNPDLPQNAIHRLPKILSDSEKGSIGGHEDCKCFICFRHLEIY